MLVTDRSVLVVIDAQRAFVDPEGSLMRAFGADDVRPGVEALGRLLAYLAERGSGPTVFGALGVSSRSVHRWERRSPIGELVRTERNIDCEWANGLVVSPHQIVVTKREADAGESPTFRAVIDEVVRREPGELWWLGFSSRPVCWQRRYQRSVWFATGAQGGRHGGSHRRQSQ